MNYTSLVSQIQNFMEDDSTEFQNSIPDIITQAESMIFSRLPSLPCYRQKQSGNLVIGTAEYAVANARMIRQVSVTKADSDVVYLKHRIDSYLRDYVPNASTQGTPFMYATKDADTTGVTILLGPVPSATLAYEVDFVGLETGLSVSNANNWIGDNAEQVLLSACLYESSSFLKAPDGVNLYKAQFDEAIALFQQEMQRNYTAEYEGGIEQMAISQAMCTSFKAEILDEQHDLLADTLKIALFTSSASLGAGTTAYSTTNEISGTGYTAGGETLGSKAITTHGTSVCFDFADPTWTSASFTANGALIYNDTNGDKAIAVLAFGGDFTVAGGTFQIVLPAAGTSGNNKNRLGVK